MKTLARAQLSCVSGGAQPAFEPQLLQCWQAADDRKTTEADRNTDRARCLNDYFDRFWVARKRE